MKNIVIAIIIEFLGEDPENLPYEPLDEFDKLRINPKFPSIGESRSHKIDDKIHDVPDMAENSKFHGFNVIMSDANE